MLFNSIEFFVFFAIVYTLYLSLRHRWQNRLLLAASYFFYGWWDWRFLALLFISTAVDYAMAHKIHASQETGKRKFFLAASVCVNLGILGFFKYFNFFSGSFTAVMNGLGWAADPVTLKIILPVGISFYTFQSLSYTIDVYRKEVEPARHFLDFALYISFFPQLVAGPIERAKHLLPQVLRPRILEFEQMRRGAVLMAWGLFKKVIIADGAARIVNGVFNQTGELGGAATLAGIYAFALQIYGDFSGYSDMARGMAKMMGFDLMLNFNLPYFARNPQDFWRRWHISLSTWLRDYLYVSLGGNRKGRLRTYLNLLVTMTLGGLWHGASWTFVIWGFYHGLLLSVHRWFSNLPNAGRNVLQRASGWGALLQILVMFHLVCLGWLIFRAPSISQVGIFLKALGSGWVGDWQTVEYWRQLFFYGFPLLAIQLIQYKTKRLDFIGRVPVLVRVAALAVLVCTVTISASVGLPEQREFIYFQF